LVKLGERGRIIVDSADQTSVLGIFAAGDVASNIAEQVLIAVSDCAKAALSIYGYLLPTL
jgi:NADH-dependent peroxiredoxin subunit F